METNLVDGERRGDALGIMKRSGRERGFLQQDEGENPCIFALLLDIYTI